MPIKTDSTTLAGFELSDITVRYVTYPKFYSETDLDDNHLYVPILTPGQLTKIQGLVDDYETGLTQEVIGTQSSGGNAVYCGFSLSPTVLPTGKWLRSLIVRPRSGSIGHGQYSNPVYLSLFSSDSTDVAPEENPTYLSTSLYNAALLLTEETFVFDPPVFLAPEKHLRVLPHPENNVTEWTTEHFSSCQIGAAVQITDNQDCFCWNANNGKFNWLTCVTLGIISGVEETP